MTSTTGRRPPIAAPTPRPTIEFSEIGVSRTRFSPNRSSSPCVTLNEPWNTPMSWPIRKTVSSRSISSASAWPTASRERNSDIQVVVDRLQLRERRLLGDLHGRVDERDRLLVQRIEIDIVEALRERLDRVALAPLLDVLVGAVLLGVCHRVALVAVRDGLEQLGLAL